MTQHFIKANHGVILKSVLHEGIAPLNVLTEHNVTETAHFCSVVFNLARTTKFMNWKLAVNGHRQIHLDLGPAQLLS